MQDIINAKAIRQIDEFLGRKSRQFPDLHIGQDLRASRSIPSRLYAGLTRKHRTLEGL